MTHTQRYKLISDEDSPVAIAQLAALIGPTEARKPSWIRRLVMLETGQLGVVVKTVSTIHTSDQDWSHPWTKEGAMSPVEVALPLAEGVALLASPESPERELDRRVKLFEKFQADKAAFAAEKERKQAEAEAQLAKDREDAERFRERAWSTDLTTLGRFATALALMVEGRDPTLANDLRILVDAGERSTRGSDPTRPIPYPRAQWWQSPKVRSNSHRWWENASTTDKPSV